MQANFKYALEKYWSREVRGFLWQELK